MLASPVANAPKSPVYVAGLFSTASGIGESARICAAALEERGVEVVRLDLSDALNQRDLGQDGQSIPELPRHGTMILHLNAPETATALIKLQLYRPRRWRVIGYWAWELEKLPASWTGAASLLSEIWTPSRFSAKAIGAQVNIPVKVVPHAVRVPPRKVKRNEAEQPGNRPFRVLVMGDGRSSLKRKNICGAVEAFQMAFEGREDVELLVKLRNMREDKLSRDLIRMSEADRRIRIMDCSISEEDRWALIAGADVMMSLHRSEGFGLAIAEAMACGVPVMATAFSGNLDFMDEASACLVSAEEVHVGIDSGPYSIVPDAKWANPDLAEAATKLRFLAVNPEARYAMARLGQLRILRYTDGSSYLDALRSAA